MAKTSSEKLAAALRANLQKRKSAKPAPVLPDHAARPEKPPGTKQGRPPGRRLAQLLVQRGIGLGHPAGA